MYFSLYSYFSNTPSVFWLCLPLFCMCGILFFYFLFFFFSILCFFLCLLRFDFVPFIPGFCQPVAYFHLCLVLHPLWIVLSSLCRSVRLCFRCLPLPSLGSFCDFHFCFLFWFLYIFRFLQQPESLCHPAMIPLTTYPWHQWLFLQI